MNGAVVVLLIALGVAAVLSVLLWFASRSTRRHSPSFLEQLDAITARSGPPVGPSNGITDLKPIQSDPLPLPERPDPEF